MLMVFSFWEPFSIPISDNPLLSFPPNFGTQIWPTILYQRSLFSNHNTKSFWKGYLNIYNNLKYFYIKTNRGKLKCEIQSGLIFVKRQETKEKELFQGKELNWKPSQQRYKSKQKKKRKKSKQVKLKLCWKVMTQGSSQRESTKWVRNLIWVSKVTG